MRCGILKEGLHRLSQIDLEHGPPTVLSTTDLVVGDKVEHHRFGRGEVQKVDSTTYSVPIVTVFFYDYDETIVIRNAGELEVVSLNEKGGSRRIAAKTAQQDFDLARWVDDMFEEITMRVGSEVPDKDQEEAYNDLSWMLRIE